MSDHSPSCVRARRSKKFFAGTLLVGVLCAPSILRAQDAVRPSLAGEAAAEARRQDVDRIPYNLMMGPVRFRLSATVGVEYNDNINFAEKDTEDDVIVRPNIDIDAIWPLTQLNTLRLDLGLGYAFYLDHSENDTNGILIAPKSQIALDIFVGDFRINVHDRMQLQQDPIQQPALSNVTDYGRFENTVGVGALWDLNKALLTLGYDHYTYVSTTSDFDYLNRNAEELSAAIQVLVSSTTGVGIEGNAVFTYYDQHVLNDSDTYSVGAFVESQLTNNLKVRAAGGYQRINFDRNAVDFFGVLAPDQKDLDDFYANILIGHRLNVVFSHSLSAGHESQLGINSNYITLNYVRYTTTWNLIRRTLLSTEFFFEDADESGGFIDEHFQRVGGAITLGYQLTPHVTLGLRYQGTSKDSDVALRDYTQNRVSLDGTYSF
ncbi:MAG TPA: outer membrane beta-barrel protein [Chthoniobacterales bacterium]|nr:outer membrane beta-barrel protein [Chthoniobacterales bacterium]